MEITDTAAVLAKIQAFTNRTFDPAAVTAWHDVLGHLDRASCLEAVSMYYAKSKDWIMPADIITQVRLLHKKRLEQFGEHPGLTDKDYDAPPRVVNRRKKELLRMIGSGQLSLEQYNEYQAGRLQLFGLPGLLPQ